MKIYFFLQIIWSVQKKAVPLHSVSEMKLGHKIGAVVQLVRIHACHAWGRGFESRPHRKKEMQSASLFCGIRTARTREYAQRMGSRVRVPSAPQEEAEMLLLLLYTNNYQHTINYGFLTGS